MKLTSDKRQALMAKLASSAGMAPPALFNPPGSAAAAAPASQPPAAGPKVDPSVTSIQSTLGPASPIATPCLLIKNMFSLEEAQDPGFKEEIEGDVKDECAKYGAVLHIHVDIRSQVGLVWARARAWAWQATRTHWCGAAGAEPGSLPAAILGLLPGLCMPVPLTERWRCASRVRIGSSTQCWW
jgi:hypothetical protein